MFLGLTVMERFKLTVVTVFNLTQLLDHIKADFVSITVNQGILKFLGFEQIFQKRFDWTSNRWVKVDLTSV